MSGWEPGDPAAEDRVVLPEKWRAELHPRRGGAPGAPLPDPATARKRLDAAVKRHKRFHELLDAPASHPALVAGVRSWLGGTADVQGGATVLRAVSERANGHPHLPGAIDFAVAELDRHGVAFLLAALAEIRWITVQGVDYPGRPAGLLREPSNTFWPETAARGVRAVLAVADEAVHAEAVSVLAGWRGTDLQTDALTVYLAPTERAWADETFAAVGALTSSPIGYVLLYGASRPEHLPPVAHAVQNHHSADGYATLADGVGGPLADLLVPEIGRRQVITEVRENLAEALAAVPSDTGYRTLLAEITSRHYCLGLRAATWRYPHRAVRLLAEAAPASGPARALLHSVLTAHPSLQTPELRALAALAPSAPLAAAVPAVLRDAGAGLPVLDGPGDAPWHDPRLLPQVLLRDGNALPVEAVARFQELLAADDEGAIAQVREAADPQSLTAFGWAQFEAWSLAGMPSREAWGLAALGRIGDDTTVRRLTPLIRAWPGDQRHAKAVEGLEVLRRIGTETALVQLNGIAQRVAFKAVKVRAQEKIAEVAADLGLTADDLADRLLPDFGLDGRSAVLGYGPRAFTVTWDDRLRPSVRDGATGRARTGLPPAAAGDDPALAKAARARFTQLKKDIAQVGGDLLIRLEHSMISGRVWDATAFRTCLAVHPVFGGLVATLLWEADGVLVRVTPDGTFAELSGAVVPSAGKVRLPHPVERDPAEFAAWKAVLDPSAQPFPQLDRPADVLTEPERTAGHLRRHEGAVIETARLLGLARRGWARGRPEDAGVERWFSRPLPGGGHLVLSLTPGIGVGVPGREEGQTVREIWLADVPNDHSRGTSCDSHRLLGTVDVRTMSEILTDLAAARA